MALLEVRGLTKAFGGLLAVNNFDLEVGKETITGMIGPNGAGKTTAFNLMTGVFLPTRGQILFDGEDITGLRSHQITAKGLVRTFQSCKVFSNFTVRDNLRAACHLHSHTGLLGTILRLPQTKRKEAVIHAKVDEILEFTGLRQLSAEFADGLPHGYKRVLGVATALATEPKLICLDEPVTGMNAEETRFMIGLIQKIRDRGTTILIVEHNMRVIMSICDRLVVLNFGTKIAEGTPAEIRSDKTVIEAYLGDSVI